eukprot:171399_1
MSRQPRRRRRRKHTESVSSQYADVPETTNNNATSNATPNSRVRLPHLPNKRALSPSSRTVNPIKKRKVDDEHDSDIEIISNMNVDTAHEAMDLDDVEIKTNEEVDISLNDELFVKMKEVKEVYGWRMNLGKKEFIRTHQAFDYYKRDNDLGLMLSWTREHPSGWARHTFLYAKCTNATKHLIKKKLEDCGVDFGLAMIQVHEDWIRLNNDCMWIRQASKHQVKRKAPKAHKYDEERKRAFQPSSSSASVSNSEGFHLNACARATSSHTNQESVMKYYEQGVLKQLVLESWYQKRLISLKSNGGKDDKIQKYRIPQDMDSTNFYMTWCVAAMILIENQKDYNVSFMPEAWRSASFHARLAQIFNIIITLEGDVMLQPIDKDMSIKTYIKLRSGFGLQSNKNDPFTVAITALWSKATEQIQSHLVGTTTSTQLTAEDSYGYDEFNRISMDAAAKKIKSLKQKQAKAQNNNDMFNNIFGAVQGLVMLEGKRALEESNMMNKTQARDTAFDPLYEEKVFNYALSFWDCDPEKYHDIMWILNDVNAMEKRSLLQRRVKCLEESNCDTIPIRIWNMCKQWLEKDGSYKLMNRMMKQSQQFSQQLNDSNHN